MSQELFDEAVRLEDEGQRERALVVWRELTELSPTRNAFLRLGNVAEDLGLLYEAEQAFTRALSIDGRSAIALASLGSLALNRGDDARAIDYLTRSSEINETAGAFTILGVALARSGNDPAAEEAYRRAIRLDPGFEEAYYNLGVLLRQNGRPSEAQPLLRTAIELDPVYAAAHRELGFVFIRSGGNPNAEAHLRKGIDLEPDDCWAHIYLGTYLFESDPEAAEVQFRIAGRLQPEWSVPLWSLGNLYESRDLAGAQSFFERAFALDPDNSSALKGIERILEKRGKV